MRPAVGLRWIATTTGLPAGPATVSFASLSTAPRMSASTLRVCRSGVIFAPCSAFSIAASRGASSLPSTASSLAPGVTLPAAGAPASSRNTIGTPRTMRTSMPRSASPDGGASAASSSSLPAQIPKCDLPRRLIASLRIARVSSRVLVAATLGRSSVCTAFQSTPPNVGS